MQVRTVHCTGGRCAPGCSGVHQALKTKGLVGAGRFERPTPCAQGRCATRLRYAPTFADLFILDYFLVRYPFRKPLSASKRIKAVSKPGSLNLHRIKTLRFVRVPVNLFSYTAKRSPPGGISGSSKPHPLKSSISRSRLRQMRLAGGEG